MLTPVPVAWMRPSLIRTEAFSSREAPLLSISRTPLMATVSAVAVPGSSAPLPKASSSAQQLVEFALDLKFIRKRRLLIGVDNGLQDRRSRRLQRVSDGRSD